MPSGPLEDVTVLDFSQALAAPYGASLFADFGADVVSVEPPSGGSQRYFISNSIFPNVGRNKRSITVDLKADGADRVVERLVESADVVVHSYTPGTMERLGCDYETLRQYNEELIYCSLTGYGESGPYRDRPAYDPLAQAMSGLMHNTGEADRKPSRVGASLIDVGTGVFAAFAVMVALWNREATGEGDKVEVSLLDTAAAFMGYWFTYVDIHDREPQRMGHTWEPYAPYGVYETADDPVYLAIGLQKQWVQMCEALDRDDWLDDPRFETNEDRLEHREAVTEAVESEFGTHARAELLETLHEANVPVAELQTIREAARDEHLRHRDMLVDLEHVDGSEVVAAGTPFEFSSMDGFEYETPPAVGADTVDVLLESGLSEDEIVSLLDAGVVTDGAE